MKKALSVLLSMAILLALLSIAPLSAGAETSGGFEYNILDDGTAEVFGYTGSETDLIIPSELDGHTVSGIRGFRFSTITSVTIPDTVTNLGDQSFSFCSFLTNVTIPDSVTSIGSESFFSCRSLAGVYITDIEAWLRIDFCGGKHSSNPLDGAHNLYLNSQLVTDLVVPDTITSIRPYAMNGCTSLTSVTIPTSVTSVGYRAFSDCTSLTSVTIPDSVTSIGDYAFSDCTSLTSITIPNSVTSIANGAFQSCEALTNVTIPDSVTSIGSRAFSGCTSLTSVVIPDFVTSIGEDVFDGTIWYDNLPDGVFYVGKVAYKMKGECPESVVIKDGTVEIARNAFEGYESLTSVTIPNSVTTIDSRAFSGCSSLTSVVIPNSVTSIGYEAFSDCTSLTSITIPNSVTSIDDYTFFGCTSLTSITIPDSVTSIGSEAFFGCTSLTGVTIPDSVTSIGYNAFGYFNVDSVYDDVPMDDFTIYGYSGSEAERYAEDNYFAFVSLGDAPTVIRGDADGDGDVTILDATAVQRHIAELPTTGFVEAAADADNDGDVTILDATAIQRHIAELPTYEGIGKAI